MLSVNDVEVTDLSFTHKIVKHIKADLVEVTIRRLPNASAFAIQRSVEGENLGIKREGGTGEVCLRCWTVAFGGMLRTNSLIPLIITVFNALQYSSTY